MRIQNNIMAMNTHRMYSINNANIAKSAEKLSSGYRINRAGDDAAGLAISEKMRSQIRGLGMASKNSQDAISLVQTAEGALQEVHTMLQRMNELAVQAATGTNQEFDRLQISKEFDQLKREINDISEQTTFNNMKILDGSLSNEGPVRSAQTAGIYATVSTEAIASPLSGINQLAGTAAVDTVAAAGGSFTLSISGTTLTDAGTITLTIDGVGIAVTATGTENADGLAALFAAESPVTLSDGSTYAITASGNTLTFTNTDDTAIAKPAAFAASIAVGANMGTAGTIPANVTSQAGTAGADEVLATKAKTTFNVDYTNLKEGDTLSFTVDGTTYDVAVDSSVTDATSLAALIGSDVTGFTASVSGDSVVLEADTAGAGAAPSVKFTVGDRAETTYIEFDATKLRVGDTISVSVGGTESTYIWQEGDTIQSVYDGLTTNGLTGATIKGNTITVEGEADVSGFVPRDLSLENYGTMRIQVGALELEQLNIQVKSMNTAGLKLDKAVCTDQDTAGSAITSTRAAIDMVSDQRSLLGAMQNRLDHKISNLDNTAENLQAAEARIRDVDIAQEMTNFTKNNILAQAATAMLAQANAAPQSVLSLLQ